MVKVNGLRTLENTLQELSDSYQVDFYVKRKISAPLNIWLIGFDHNSLSAKKALALIKASPQIIEAQFNHILEHRATLPNDTYIGSQWQYVNNGSNGGVVDADLDADDAWDIATGGITANGDTIVVCIIDEDWAWPGLTKSGHSAWKCSSIRIFRFQACTRAQDN